MALDTVFLVWLWGAVSGAAVGMGGLSLWIYLSGRLS